MARHDKSAQPKPRDWVYPRSEQPPTEDAADPDLDDLGEAGPRSHRKPRSRPSRRD